jgi:hypothetical protein
MVTWGRAQHKRDFLMGAPCTLRGGVVCANEWGINWGRGIRLGGKVRKGRLGMATSEQFQERLRQAVREAVRKVLAEGNLPEREQGEALFTRTEDLARLSPGFFSRSPDSWAWLTLPSGYRRVKSQSARCPQLGFRSIAMPPAVARAYRRRPGLPWSARQLPLPQRGQPRLPHGCSHSSRSHSSRSLFRRRHGWPRYPPT